eukprot:11418535-Alexandrium_andersonii.AAC.1
MTTSSISARTWGGSWPARLPATCTPSSATWGCAGTRVSGAGSPRRRRCSRWATPSMRPASRPAALHASSQGAPAACRRPPS